MNIPWNISIVNTGLGLGSKTIANDSLVEKMRHDGLARPEKIVNSIGIKNRYIVGEKEDHEFLVKKSLDQTSWAKRRSTNSFAFALKLIPSRYLVWLDARLQNLEFQMKST